MRTAHFAAMFIALAGVVCAHAQSPATNTPQAFQSQFHAVFDAFQQHNKAAMQDRLQSFAIPSNWFTSSFLPGQSAEFARQYSEAFADFKRRTTSNFARVDALKARIHVDAATPVDIRTRRWTPAESSAPPHLSTLRVPLPPIQKFEIDYVLDAPGQGARLTSWIESFIYLDGAFRFFGQGSKPFWMPSPKLSNPQQ